jgi:hypothetical protein
VTERFAWVEAEEMFSLLLARGATPEELAATLTDGTAERLPSPDSWPERSGAVKFVTGEQDGWAYALAFDSGLLPDVTQDAAAQRWDVVSMWFDINANSDFRYYRDTALVRRCSVIGFGFEPSEGAALSEEEGLFREDSEWDEKSDGLELVARIADTVPQQSWWSTAPHTWSADARF